jgi:ferredoxin-NADP reductase
MLIAIRKGSLARLLFKKARQSSSMYTTAPAPVIEITSTSTPQASAQPTRMLQPWLQGVITSVKDETDNTKRFFIEIPSLERFDFEPGQFVTIDLPIHEQKNKRWRSYSIASAPNGTNQFELVIVKLEGGLGTAWFWEHGHVGTELTFRGPVGKFTLPETIEKDLYLICTGTGIAPFRSMVHNIFNRQIPHQNIYLIFGCRKFADGLYLEELKALEEKLEGFHFLPVFSREAADNSAQALTGYVHAVYEEMVGKQSAVDNGNGPELKPSSFYLCGWKNMVDEAKQRIQDLGFDKKAIHLELYG